MKPLDPLKVPLDGFVLIEASAGTGKTYTITSLFLRLLLEKRHKVDQIAVVTFTKAATAELRARVRARLAAATQAFRSGDPKGDSLVAALLQQSADRQADLERLVVAQQSLDQASIFTIHGLCQRLLIEHAFESRTRFDAQLIADERPFISELVHDFWTRHIATLDELRMRYLEQVSLGERGLLALAHIGLAWPEMPLVAAEPCASLEAELNGYLLARRRVRSIWRDGGSEAARQLETNSALKGTSTKPEAISRYRFELEHFLETEHRSLYGFPGNAVSRLSQSELRKATRVGREVPVHELFSALELLAAAHQRTLECLARWLVELKQQLIQFVRDEAARRKERRGVQSFDDLLYQLRDALAGPGAVTLRKTVQQRFPAAMIDEFQDTDPVQYEVFKQLYRGAGSLILIGDPKQAIYAFRGADIFSYLNAARDVGEHAYTLNTSYRADPNLVAAQNTLFARPHLPFVFEAIDYQQVAARPGAIDRYRHGEQPAPAFKVLFLRRDEAETYQGQLTATREEPCIASWVAQDIALLLASDARINDRPVQPRDIAVLTRKNDQAREVQDALRALGVPSVLHGDSSVFDTQEATDLALIMRCLAEPSHSGFLRTALATPLLGVRAAELEALRSNEQGWEGHVETFRALQDVWRRRGFVHAMHELFRTYDVDKRLLGLVRGERAMTNLHHLIELLYQAETEEHLGTTGLCAWFQTVRFSPEARLGMAPESQQIRLESDEHAVQVTTMHKSKGLEYGIVYSPFLWRSTELWASEKQNLRYHAPEQDHRLVLDLRPDTEKKDALALAAREALAETMRLLYVSLTRAKYQNVLVWGSFRNAGTSPLGYLFHQPHEDLGGFGESLDTRLKQLSDDALKQELSQNVDHQADLLTLVDLDRHRQAPRYERERPVVIELHARPLERVFDDHERTTSFSLMTQRASRHATFASIGRDVDEVSFFEETPAERREAGTSAVPLADFPRGARPGDLLHSILEKLDFTDEAALPSLTARALARFGFDVDRLCEPLSAALLEVLRTPLDATGLCLSMLSPAQCRAELEFTLPILPGRAGNKERLSCQAIAQVFRRRAPGLGQAYPTALEQLGFEPVLGFLRGFIDLVFEHRGRYYLVDYKSNHLGHTAADYAPERLSPAMQEHHYTLQYHLYVVALHRFLQVRLAGYRYEQHFGGVYYLFLRGMARERGTETGVFFDRPSEDLILDLDALFEGAGE